MRSTPRAVRRETTVQAAFLPAATQMREELFPRNYLSPIGFCDAGFKIGQFVRREANYFFRLACENEYVRSVLELRIVHDDRALDYSTSGDFHAQMILHTHAGCTTDLERAANRRVLILRASVVSGLLNGEQLALL